MNRIASLAGKMRPGSKEEQKVDFDPQRDIPFDLNQLFQLTYGFDVLKNVIEHLAKGLKGAEKKVNDLDIKLTTKLMSIDKLKTQNEEQQKQINHLNDVTKELESKSEQTDKDVLDLKSLLDSLNFNMTLSNNRAKKLEEKHLEHNNRLKDHQIKLDDLERLIKDSESKPHVIQVEKEKIVDKVKTDVVITQP